MGPTAYRFVSFLGICAHITWHHSSSSKKCVFQLLSSSTQNMSNPLREGAGHFQMLYVAYQHICIRNVKKDACWQHCTETESQKIFFFLTFVGN